jgi:hypothetical protein
MSAKSIKGEGAKQPATAATNLIGTAECTCGMVDFKTDILTQLEVELV